MRLTFRMSGSTSESRFDADAEIAQRHKLADGTPSSASANGAGNSNVMSFGCQWSKRPLVCVCMRRRRVRVGRIDVGVDIGT